MAVQPAQQIPAEDRSAVCPPADLGDCVGSHQHKLLAGFGLGFTNLYTDVKKLAVAELGRGRVVAVTDAGWITNDVLADKGIGGVVITNHDNGEIFRRLTCWAAGLDEPSR